MTCTKNDLGFELWETPTQRPLHFCTTIMLFEQRYVIWTEVCYPNIHTRAFCISTLLRTGVTLFVYCHSRRTTWNSQVLLLPVETNIQITRYNNNQETDSTPNSVDLYKYQDYATEQLSLKSKSIKGSLSVPDIWPFRKGIIESIHGNVNSPRAVLPAVC